MADNALVPLSMTETRQIRQQQSHRIIKSRLLHTMKPLETLDGIAPEDVLEASPEGEPCKAKVRWIARGDRDPDIFKVDSSSPVVSRDGFFLCLQIIASMKWRLHFADFSQAFMQGGWMKRDEPLYTEQPKEGLPGIEPGILLKVLKTAYGLTDAPAEWNRHIDSKLKQLGYVPSTLDRVYFLHDKNQSGPQALLGVLLLATDDFIDAGTEIHQAKMQELKQMFRLGKWEYSQGRFCGKDVVQNSETGDIHVSQKFYADLKCKQYIKIH